MMAKKKRMWVSSGVPDFMIILKSWGLLFIELKTIDRKKSKVSPEQKIWIEKLNSIDNIAAEVAYWSNEAIKILQEYEEL